MKTKVKVLMLFSSFIMAAATLAPSAWPPEVSPEPGPYTFECPDVFESPFDYSTARLIRRVYCVITCNYEDGSKFRISKYAPEGLCEATDTGATYN